jgi:Family of unknown function (DUF6603)
MTSTAGTFEMLALELGNALKPLKDLLGPDIFARLGIELPREISGDATLVANLTTAAGKAGDLEPKIASLATAITADNTASIISSALQLTATVSELIAKLVEVGNALHQAANALPAADRTKLQDFASVLATRVLEFMAVGYLDEKLPSLTSGLSVLGLIDKEMAPSPNLDATETSGVTVPRRIYLDRIPTLISHPDQYFTQTFKWGANDFDGDALLTKAQGLIESLGSPAAIYRKAGQPPVLEAFVFKVSADKTVSPPGLKAELSLPATVAVPDYTVDFSGLWKGTVHVAANFNAGLELTARPPFSVNLKPPTGAVDLALLLGLKAKKTEADPIVILSAAGGARLQAQSIGGSVGINAKLDSTGGAVVPAVQFSVENGKLILDFSKSDGFIKTLTAGIKVEAGFGMVGSWNPTDGLRLEGQGGVEMFIPVHIDLSVVLINGVYVSIGIASDPPLQVGLATQFTANFGPLVAVVDRIGVLANFRFPPNGGNLGLADLSFDFQPPRGVGLSVDAGVIKGGGFLSLDFAKGEYFGALELTFEGIISLKAIGIINTKMPDGSDGFALLILITAEFTPIQLGFGFTLNGVGGLLGANRTTDIDALKLGVRTGAVSSILFPQDIIANITRIISDLKSIFPIAEGHFLIGPMAKIGWGTPTLISLELGVIIDIPVPRVIILGVLRCILPTEEAPLLRLQVNFAGGIDFDQGLIWFDASLFDSNILVFTLTGDMALRIGWKNPMFVLSVGGFHPAFKEIPSDLTGMRRLTIALLSGDNPRLTVQTYFAVTSNSVQNGARVELYAEACGFNVYGFLGYDLLVQFNPFHFIASIAAGLALRDGTDEIAGIHVSGTLSGPTPWHAEGDASITILFFDISVGFSVTWGEQGPAQPQEIEDVLALVVAALEDKRNWKFDIPPNANQGVTLRKMELAEGDIVVHPFGILSVSQKVVPLGLEINKFGHKVPGVDKIFDLTTAEGTADVVKEEFAMANFLQMTDSDKVARKSFEQIKGGLKLTPEESTDHGFEIEKDVNYELSYLHRKRGLLIWAGIRSMFTGMFGVLVGGNAIAKSAYSVSKRNAACAPAKVEIQGEAFTVVNVSDLTPLAPEFTASSEAEAYGMADAAIKANPALRGTIQVISAFEAA